VNNQEIVDTIEDIIERYGEFLDSEATTIHDILQVGVPLYAKAWDLGYELKYHEGYQVDGEQVEGFVYAVSLLDGSSIY
jgi:hypothetical protein